jgi:hypothetical protein
MLTAEEMEPAGHVHVNEGRLWAGGVATAIVAALAVLAGVLITRGVLGIPVLAPKAASDFGDSSTAVYAGLAAGCALLATALLHVPAGPAGEQDLHRHHQHRGRRGRDLPALRRRPRRHPSRRPPHHPEPAGHLALTVGCAQ